MTNSVILRNVNSKIRLILLLPIMLCFVLMLTTNVRLFLSTLDSMILRIS